MQCLGPTPTLIRAWSDGKKPDGLTLVPWQSGKALCWDVTVTCPLADSYITGAACEAGSAAQLATSHKEEKYAAIDGRYIFERIAIEPLGVFSMSAYQLLTDLSRSISQISGKVTESGYLLQRCSVLVQRFNAILLHEVCRPLIARTYDHTHYITFFNFLNPSGIYLLRVKKENNNNNNTNNKNNAISKKSRSHNGSQWCYDRKKYWRYHMYFC